MIWQIRRLVLLVIPYRAGRCIHNSVPTPVDSSKRPDLGPLEKASATVGTALAKNLNSKLIVQFITYL